MHITLSHIKYIFQRNTRYFWYISTCKGTWVTF